MAQATKRHRSPSERSAYTTAMVEWAQKIARGVTAGEITMDAVEQRASTHPETYVSQLEADACRLIIRTLFIGGVFAAGVWDTALGLVD